MSVDLEQALKGSKAVKKLRLSLVLEGPDAEVVKMAMVKAGINGTNRGFVREAVLFYLKSRLAVAEKAEKTGGK